MQTDFPLGPRASLTPDLLSTVAHAYGLGPMHTVADLGGAYNLNVRLNSDAGDFVLRVYRPWVTPQRLQAIQAVKRQLHTVGIPLVLPLPTRDGQTVFTYAQRCIELEPHLPHDGSADTAARYVQAFALLGRLHGVPVDITALPAPRVANEVAPPILYEWVQHTHQRITPQEPSADAALALCDETLQLLDPLCGWWERMGSRLSRTLSHGDYGGGNVLFKAESIVALVDFDFLDTRERIFDIGYALFWMFHRLQANIPYAQRAWARVPELLAHYDAHSAQPLSQAERRAVWMEMARVPLYWVGEAAFLPDPVAAVLQVAPGVSFARWLLAHTDELSLQTGM
jgi:homoserine kinase type II